MYNIFQFFILYIDLLYREKGDIKLTCIRIITYCIRIKQIASTSY